MKFIRWEKWGFPLNKETLFHLLASVGLNVVGKLLSAHFELPFWLDTIGTCCVAAALGPYAGAVVGFFTMVILAPLFNIGSLFYIPVAVGVGLCMGYNLYRKEHISSYTYCAAILTTTFISIALSIIPNLIIYGGYTGNRWGDALVDQFSKNLRNKVVCTIAGEWLVDFPDRLISIGFYAIGHNAYRAKEERKKREEAGLPPEKFEFKKWLKEKLPFLNIQSIFAAILIPVLLFDMTASANVTGTEEAPSQDLQNINYSENHFFSNFIATSYGVKDGLLSMQMNSVTQTPDGFIWAGGYSGLYRFDGRTFEAFNPGGKIPSVSSLFTDSSGRLWIGSNENGLATYNPTTGEVINYDMSWSMPSEAISAICEDEKGNIYAGTDSYLVMITKNGIVGVFNTLEELKDIKCLAANDEGFIMGATADGLIFLFYDGILLQTIQDEEEAVCHSIASDGKDNFLAIYEDGCYQRFTLVSGRLVGQRAVLDERGLDLSNAVYSEESGGFFCGSEKGMCFLDDMDHLYLVQNGNYAERGITDVMFDNQGNLWMASSIGGITKYSESQFLNLKNYTGINFNTPKVTFVRDGLLYIGTSKGLIILDAETYEEQHFGYQDTIDTKEVRYIFDDEKGNLYFCAGPRATIYKVTPDGRVVVMDATPWATEGKIVSADITPEGQLVAATAEHVVFFGGETVRTCLGKENGLQTSEITQVVQSDTGRVLVGTADNGIIILEGDQVYKQINISSGLSNANVKRIIHYKDGFFYITSNAIYYDDRENIRRLENFPYSDNYDIFRNDKDEFFILGSAGIYVVEGEKFYHDQEYPYVLINSNNGLDDTLLSGTFSGNDGNNLYICARDTVLLMDTTEHSTYSDNFNIVLENVTADGKVINAEGRMFHVPGGTETLEIHPRFLDYSASDLLIRYQLKGPFNVESDSHISSFEGLEFTEPPSGNYTLTVQVLDELNYRVLKEEKYFLAKELQFYEQNTFKWYKYSVLAVFLLFVAWTLAKQTSMTLIRRQYDEIKVAKDNAERANRAKSKFLAQMSHEIRTPINSVLGMDEMIIRESRERNIQEYATDIYQAGRTLLSLINEILDFSKIEADAMELVPVDYEIASLIHDLYTMTVHRADAKNLKLELKVDPNMPYMYHGDDVRIRQIITNLLTNAVKYTQEGTVWLRVWGTREYDKELIHVEVEDTGIGIKPENLEHLFDDYSQFDNEKNRFIEGTGLGLGIATKLLKMMGSELKVESIYGQGSRFYFDLYQPIVNEEPIGDFQKRVSEVAASRDLTTKGFIAPECNIMVVDDNSMNLRVFVSLLKVTQLNITEAGGGAEAVMLAEHMKFDMIFMDHMMPEVDGVEALKRIRALPDSLNADTPIYVLTANAVAGAKEQYLAEGFTGFLSKPIVFDRLMDALREHLPKEKLLPMPEEDEQKVLMSGAAMPDDLPIVEGVDWAACWIHLSNLEVVQDTMKEFYELLIPNMEKLQTFFKSLQINPKYSKAIEGYRIQVHAMKGAANTLGIFPLAGMAKVLEFAAKAEDTDRIFKLHPIFQEEWCSYKDKLQGVFGIGEEKEKQEAEGWMLESFLSLIENAMEEMDVDAADNALDRMKGYEFSPKVQELMPVLSAAVTALDEDAVKQVTARMREE